MPRRHRGATDRLGMRTLHPAARKRIRQRKLIEQDYKCCYCGRSLTESTATIEHIVPCATGGTNDDDNLAVACADCNNRRSNT